MVWETVVAVAAGLILGAGLVWFALARSQRALVEARTREHVVRLEEARNAAQEERRRLNETFHAVASDALAANTEQFLHLARATFEAATKQAEGDLGKRHQAIEELVKPLRENLEKLEKSVQELEQKRQAAYATLGEQLRKLSEDQSKLQAEARNLANALRNPQARGRWGELALQRVVELAGMTEYCDFDTQVEAGGDGDRRRPDVVVRLPGGRCVVVDAKAPVDAFLDYVEATTDEQRKTALARHVQNLRSHLRALSGKQYHQQFDGAPEFVVMFIPGEAFFGAAVEAWPSLIEEGAQANVIVATPTTLIALLRTIASGWDQQRLAEGAEEVRRLGRDLYDRLATVTGYVADVGTNLQRTVKSYNQLVASHDTRLLVAARRFRELGAGTADELDPPELVNEDVRPPAARDKPE